MVGVFGKKSDEPYVPLELKPYFLFGDSYEPYVPIMTRIVRMLQEDNRKLPKSEHGSDAHKEK